MMTEIRDSILKQNFSELKKKYIKYHESYKVKYLGKTTKN